MINIGSSIESSNNLCRPQKILAKRGCLISTVISVVLLFCCCLCGIFWCKVCYTIGPSIIGTACMLLCIMGNSTWFFHTHFCVFVWFWLISWRYYMYSCVSKNVVVFLKCKSVQLYYIFVHFLLFLWLFWWFLFPLCPTNTTVMSWLRKDKAKSVRFVTIRTIQLDFCLLSRHSDDKLCKSGKWFVSWLSILPLSLFTTPIAKPLESFVSIVRFLFCDSRKSKV